MNKTTERAIVGELMPTNDDDKRMSVSQRDRALSNSSFVAQAKIGRQKGSLNKTTRKVRETILRTFDKIGGEKRFTEWAHRNPDEFYRYFMRLLPVEDRAAKPSVAIVLVKNADKV